MRRVFEQHIPRLPFRSVVAEAIGESILWLRQFKALREQNSEAIDTLVRRQDPVSTSRFLLRTLAPHALLFLRGNAGVAKVKAA
jgi:hypothetical protein